MIDETPNGDPVGAPVTTYRMSTDYRRLYDLLCAGHTLVAFVDYRFHGSEDMPPMRDVCKVERVRPWEIRIFARGIGYGGVDRWNEGRGDSEDAFFTRICAAMNLEWIEPTEQKEIPPFAESRQK